jgi:hypothetical protein
MKYTPDKIWKVAFTTDNVQSANYYYFPSFEPSKKDLLKWITRTEFDLDERREKKNAITSDQFRKGSVPAQRIIV